jgi:hypothetical protein
MPDVRSVYLARGYAYVAAGRRGLVILDITVPDRPRVDQVFDAGGCIDDLNDVKLGITYVSEFAYLADGKNGLRVVQLTSPETPGNDGFTPRPTPCLVATYKLPHGGHALSVSKGLDRDRAVDESGNQIAVLGRVGARPLNKEEQRKLYLHGGRACAATSSPDDGRQILLQLLPRPVEQALRRLRRQRQPPGDLLVTAVLALEFQGSPLARGQRGQGEPHLAGQLGPLQRPGRTVAGVGQVAAGEGVVRLRAGQAAERPARPAAAGPHGVASHVAGHVEEPRRELGPRPVPAPRPE